MAKVGNFEVMIGCDPEFFVKKDGQLISAFGLIGGTKKNPFKVKGGAVQVDGMALEFNIDPSANPKDFRKNIDKVLEALKKMTPSYEFDFTPVAEFGSEYIKSQPLEARMLGCDPDFNAYTNAPNPVPNADAPFRTASGHVHISWKDTKNTNWPDEIDPFTPSHIEACNVLVKTLDAYLGIPSLIWDKDTKRRQLYGKAGCYRPKCYGNGWFGLEYRVLSNAWLNYPFLTDLIYQNTLDAFAEIFKDYDTSERLYYGMSAKDIVNSENLEDVSAVIARVVKAGKIKSPKYYRELREAA